VNPSFDVADGPDVELGPPSKRLLRQTEPEATRSELPGQILGLRDNSWSQDRLERRPAARPGDRLIALPRSDAYVPAAEPRGKGVLREAQIHPALTDPLPEGKRLVRITPWEHARSTAGEPQAGKRQRNGACADSWVTRRRAARAALRSSLSTARA
jgi:hypothetical protein